MSKQFTFGSALAERNFEQKHSTLSAKRMLAYQLEKTMAAKGRTRVELSKQLGTSRAALNRLLDSENESVTLKTILAAAEALDLEVVITLKKRK